MPEKKIPHLGGLTATQFLRGYWQKKPLLIRKAFPDFIGLLPIKNLLGMTQGDEVQSRLVQHEASQWDLQHGPFKPSYLKRLPKKNWTILIQELNHHAPSGASLLQQFSFIPHARLDDLMVSIAAPGGGVGAHFDSYDVFLLQGEGQRRWEISAQKDLTLAPDAPLKILNKFKPEQEWVLGPGDMLYLPPNYAHKGTAETTCTTYSIGFRAPSAQELATQFLIHLQDNLSLSGMYTDPDLGLQQHPAQISAAMLEKVAAILKKIRWAEADVSTFLGRYLTEPKPHVFFSPPATNIAQATFLSSAKKRQVSLAPQSRMLFYGARFFINGESCEALPQEVTFLHELANQRQVALPARLEPAAKQRLFDWYNYGYITFGN